MRIGFLHKILAIVHKDIIAELRTKEMFSSMFVFALLVIVIFNFAFELRVANIRQVAPGVLWVTFTFAGILGLNRSFILEKDRGCLEGLLLAPVDRSASILARCWATCFSCRWSRPLFYPSSGSCSIRLFSVRL